LASGDGAVVAEPGKGVGADEGADDRTRTGHGAHGCAGGARGCRRHLPGQAAGL